jgi:hypothetical protein
VVSICSQCAAAKVPRSQAGDKRGEADHDIVVALSLDSSDPPPRRELVNPEQGAGPLQMTRNPASGAADRMRAVGVSTVTATKRRNRQLDMHEGERS